ncbi:inorganic phosphate transporter [Nocardia miyunensis]|uniref:inorganic phosphate transporter n=1 Tax=Nocardia miyunensis TaxID=282684 RepID=UPI00083772BC|nr:inorganic phosphate transporter [Nocardia miyunensis]
MSAELIVLLIVIVTALAFDFTNGFHDTANAMATSIATGALGPRTAVAMSGVLNLIGAFLSVEVAKTVSSGLLRIDNVHGMALLQIVFAGLVGGILWNLITWLFGIPSSSTHALFGGLIGSAMAALGVSGVIWTGNEKTGLINKVVVPAVLAPVVAAIVAGLGTYLVYRLTRASDEAKTRKSFRIGQIGSAALVSLAHGTNDAQKTMGVIFMALVAHGVYTNNDDIPLWVKICCALAIALGTYLGGWRIIRTLGKGLVEIDAPQGFAAEASSAAIILTSAQFGLPLSTTHAATGSILGTGLGKPGAEVRWGVLGRMGVAWIITLPLAAVVGAVCWGITDLVPGLGGVLIDLVILIAASAYIYLRSRRNKVDTSNVNEDWDGGLTPPSEVAAPADKATTAA